MITESDDARMMVSPSKWPAWPILPLKRRIRGKKDRYDDRKDFGLLVEGYGLTVFIRNMYEEKPFAQCEQENFDSADECAKVWMVD